MAYTWGIFFMPSIQKTSNLQMLRPGVSHCLLFCHSIINTSLADITDQFNLIFQNTIQAANDAHNINLLYHGYDFSHTAVWASVDRGHSPEVWDRALGWYAMALVDVLDIIPTSHPGHATILNILRTLAPRIRSAADASSGVWWLVMTQPGRTGNYFESSGSAMFVYALLKGVRLGYIPDSDGSIVRAAQKAYQYMTSHWVVPNPDGTMTWTNTVEVRSDFCACYMLIRFPLQVGSLSGNGTYEVSKHRLMFIPEVIDSLAVLCQCSPGPERFEGIGSFPTR